MVNIFTVGTAVVRCDLHALGPNGPYRLVVHSPRGSIVEYFDSAIAALIRQAEIEDLFRADPARRSAHVPLAVSRQVGIA